MVTSSPLPEPSTGNLNMEFEDEKLLYNVPVHLTSRVLTDRARQSRKRHLFAWHLIKCNDIFSDDDKIGRNVFGNKLKKESLYSVKLSAVKYLTMGPYIGLRQLHYAVVHFYLL